MTTRTPDTPFDPTLPIDPAWTALAASWRRSLAALNRSPRTISGYLDSQRRFGAWLCERSIPQQPASIKREHVEAFIAWQLEMHRPASAATHYRNLRQFFRWLCEEEEIDRSPMERMHEPTLPETPPPVLAIDEMRAMLHACEGRDFFARRDTALLRLLIDTGLRRHEVAQMQVADVHLDTGEALIHGKRRQDRVISLGKRTLAALDRYMLRARAAHKHADDPALWLGQDGALTDDGLYQIVRRRAAQAGLEGVYTHLFRHTFASEWLDGGGSEGDAMELAGWRSRTMLDRYGRAARSKRARDAHKRLSPGDRI